eukprot:Nk52_evm1s738 gene=Nk52_evmTU1s738
MINNRNSTEASAVTTNPPTPQQPSNQITQTTQSNEGLPLNHPSDRLNHNNSWDQPPHQEEEGDEEEGDEEEGDEEEGDEEEEEEEEEEEDSDENESASDYCKGGYHPVKINDVYNGRYRILKKLGWGHFSVVWLAKDLKASNNNNNHKDNNNATCSSKYVALKIVKSASQYTEAALDEVKILRIIHDQNPESTGRDFTVQQLDDFRIQGPNGAHVVMVFEVLGNNLLRLIKKYNYEGIPMDLVRSITRQILHGLHYLHTECGIIHTDIKPENVMFCVDEQFVEEMGRFYEQEADALKEEKMRAMKMRQKLKQEQQHQQREAAAVNGSNSSLFEGLNKNQKKKLKAKMKRQQEREAAEQQKRKNELADDGSSKTAQQASSESLHGLEKNFLSSTDLRGGEGDAAAATAGSSAGIGAVNGVHSDEEDEEEGEVMVMSDGEVNHNVMAVDERHCVVNASVTASVGGGGSSTSGSMMSIATSTMAMSSTASSTTQLGGVAALSRTSSQFLSRVEYCAERSRVKIVDLGNACYTTHHFTEDIQTRQYRSPEVIIGAPYGPSADIWSMACMIFELATGDYLFDPHSDPQNRHSRDEDHLALMTELLGRFPRSFIFSGKYSKECFNRRGELRHIRDLGEWRLRDVFVEKYHFDPVVAKEFTDFLLPMLNIVPQNRATALECLKHPWLAKDDAGKQHSSTSSTASSGGGN